MMVLEQFGRTPLRIGPFTVDQFGMLSPSSPTLFPAFTLRWRGRLVRASLMQEMMPSETWQLGFSSRVGRIPSTATQTAQRGHVLQMMRHLPTMLPEGWRLMLRADHTIELIGVATIIMPVSAVGLITAITSFLLELDPYLCVLDEGGIGVCSVKTP
jgi:hypothetical protein